MKALNKICWILAIVLGLGSIVLFFMDFATITTGVGEVTLVGTQLGFGSKLEVAKNTYDMAKSTDIWFCFWTSVIATVLSVVSFKTKKLRYAAPAVGLVSAVYMLVIALSNPWKFVDTRPLPSVTDVKYESFVLFTAIALIAFVVLAAAHLFIDDYIEVLESKGEKKTIIKRVIQFFRDYKSEIKKIVWPGWKEVIKNTVIVLIICLIIGAFIWLVDYGLANLIWLILGVKNG